MPKFRKARLSMVDKLFRPMGIKNISVLNAFKLVPRQTFLNPPFRHQAYVDEPLPIDEGQTTSQPSLIALMIQILNPAPGQNILEIGTGSGYSTAVLALIFKQVYTIELNPILIQKASRILSEFRLHNIHYKSGDGFLGWPDFSPFDSILVFGAFKELPLILASQLTNHGKMVVPLGPPSGRQTLTLVTKENDQIKFTPLLDVRFVSLDSP